MKTNFFKEFSGVTLVFNTLPNAKSMEHYEKLLEALPFWATQASTLFIRVCDDRLVEQNVWTTFFFTHYKTFDPDDLHQVSIRFNYERSTGWTTSSVLTENREAKRQILEVIPYDN